MAQEIQGYDLHEECKHQCRSDIIFEWIEKDVEALARADESGWLPLHILLTNPSSSIDDALLMIEKYPDALKYRGNKWYQYLPLHIECRNQCRSVLLSACMEKYPGAVSAVDAWSCIQLYYLLRNANSSIDDVLLMIKKYHAMTSRNLFQSEELPIHLEFAYRSRPSIIKKCIEIHPASANQRSVTRILSNIHNRNVSVGYSGLSLVFAANPSSLYDRGSNEDDLRHNPYFRRRILSLLPRHVFSPIHDADFAELNWQPRGAMLLFLSQIR
jgi:hypothetical protein